MSSDTDLLDRLQRAVDKSGSKRLVIPVAPGVSVRESIRRGLRQLGQK